MKRLPTMARALAAALAGVVAASSPAFAAEELPSLVHDIGISLLLSGVLAVAFTRIKLPALAGFIIAGIVAGPLALGWVTDPANINTIAELGFVLLLFMIGLEIDIGKIRAAGRSIVLGGLLQFPLTLIFGVIAVKLLALTGISLFQESLAALYIGVVIAAVVTRSLEGWWRLAALVPTLYLTAMVWENILAQNPSVTALILFGAMLIALMTVRPQGLLGSARVEVV